MRNRRITQDEKALLVEAIEQGRVANATDFAEAFAEERGLKPETVRTAISRIRRERGYLTRGPDRISGAVPITTVRHHRTLHVTDAIPVDDLVDLAAAAIVRYERDPEFRRRVDERRGEVSEIYDTVRALQTQTKNIPNLSREVLISLLADE